MSTLILRRIITKLLQLTHFSCDAVPLKCIPVAAWYQTTHHHHDGNAQRGLSDNIAQNIETKYAFYATHAPSLYVKK